MEMKTAAKELKRSARGALAGLAGLTFGVESSKAGDPAPEDFRDSLRVPPVTAIGKPFEVAAEVAANGQAEPREKGTGSENLIRAVVRSIAAQANSRTPEEHRRAFEDLLSLKVPANQQAALTRMGSQGRDNLFKTLNSEEKKTFAALLSQDAELTPKIEKVRELLANAQTSNGDGTITGFTLATATELNNALAGNGAKINRILTYGENALPKGLTGTIEAIKAEQIISNNLAGKALRQKIDATLMMIR